MLRITVCIGSNCYVRGSKKVVEELQFLIAKNDLTEKIELSGTFCMGKCHDGCSVTIGDTYFSVDANKTKEFFEKEILPRIK